MTLAAATVIQATPQADSATYLPLVFNPEPEPMVEFRGLWVSRYDWTSTPTTAKIDEIVNNAALAGFNVLFFQVRGEADAYYASNYEPWAVRLTGTLGQNPGWDPLGYLVEKAHAQGIQVHAYVNVYTLWLGCNAPPSGTTPPHLYYTLLAKGETEGKIDNLQWNTNGEVICADYPPTTEYQRVSPASIEFDTHLMNVAADLVTHYDIDGIHLDHIRYAGSNSSCDPISEARYGTNCFGYNGQESYADWQRRQVNGTVRKFYEEVVPLKDDLWLSAAVWPVYQKKPEWGWTEYYQQGYSTYYQDSKAWIADGYIDSISPMIYPGGTINCPDDNIYWTQERWQTLVTDFQADSNGRYIIPGIGAGYCTFDEIEARINMGRQIGTVGHAIFSYRGLLAGAYFDDFANGPYAVPAVVPTISWHP